MPAIRCLCRMNSWLGKHTKISCSQRNENSPAVGDVGETLFSPPILFTEGIKCPLVDLAWFKLGSAPQCYTRGRFDSHLQEGCNRSSQIKIQFPYH